MKKEILAILLAYSSISSATDFEEFTTIVSHEIGSNVYFDKEIEDYYINIDDLPFQPMGSELLTVYKNALNEHNLTLNKDDDFYYITHKKDVKKILKYYTYQVENLLADDIKKLLTLFPGLNYKFLTQSDMVVFQSLSKDSKHILNLLKSADSKLKQERVKITILNTNNLKGKEFGTKIDKFGVDFDYFLNLIIGTPITTSSNISNTGAFKAFLTSMTNEGITNIEQSPTLLLRDGKKTEFKSVTNIPFLESTQQITETLTNEVEQLNYKDVGLTVSVVPKIKNDYIYLDLKLVSEDLLTARDDIRPVTQKIEYTNSLKLQKGETILLTGLRKKSIKKQGFKVPVLGDLPIVNILFDYRSESEELENISILIESLS